MGACVLQLCHPMEQSPLLLAAQGSAVTIREQQCSQPQLLCRMGCLEVGLDLGSPTLHCSNKYKHGISKYAGVVWCVTAFMMPLPLGKTKIKKKCHKVFFHSHSAGSSGAMGKEIPELLFWTCLQSKYGECALCVLDFVMQDLSLALESG